MVSKSDVSLARETWLAQVASGILGAISALI
jgi:hypothetical protein